MPIERTDTPSDEALVQIAREDPESVRSRQAASELLGRYAERVYIWCFRFVHEHERALDLSQDVLMSAYTHLESFGGQGRFFSWIFAITRNRCINAVQSPSLLRDEEVELEDLPAPHAGPEQLREEQADELVLLDLVRERLDPLEQRAIRLRCTERMPVDEITVILRIEEVSGARGVLQRARRKLRAALADRRNRNGRPEGRGTMEGDRES
ncbi:MAG: sigma-70 family RNA polymerase sigma factor [Candidatus Eisenbacteria bacterium]|uniref:Sigma-70 family RNA polymerase sigma factor n=1 Tax=Eiseniibacteriota bacterium TaxID=2212470 RepID=A0A948RQV9_UNCEI|nr:sigma-70 family RNA polymerase sigma factor [Candidatus Eisenbacteria bacterium]MBU1948499.1 sigma-70 family RNA polymerase sigma factor [Candidatus Eisenbacteria bacterium]MBU2689315.1 sigma-70 family RNA polymerase sigma factor [Candidatus Eisenbacteria bacterium]